jgi:hypothetical protein
MVEALVESVLHHDGEVEEVAGEAADMLRQRGGLAAVLRF